MPKANALSITQRRCVLTGIMAAPFLVGTPGTATAAPFQADAALFACHQRFHAVYSAVRAASCEPSPAFGTPECNAREALFDKMVLEECDLLEELAAIPAHTRQGQRLKAEVILALLPEHLRHNEQDGETQLVLSLARDLVRENAA